MDGWKEFDVNPNMETFDEKIEFARRVERVFSTEDGKEVLDAMIRRYMMVDIVCVNDTQFGAGIKQGRASVIKAILGQLELSRKG